MSEELLKVRKDAITFNKDNLVKGDVYLLDRKSPSAEEPNTQLVVLEDLPDVRFAQFLVIPTNERVIVSASTAWWEGIKRVMSGKELIQRLGELTDGGN